MHHTNKDRREFLSGRVCTLVLEGVWSVVGGWVFGAY